MIILLNCILPLTRLCLDAYIKIKTCKVKPALYYTQCACICFSKGSLFHLNLPKACSSLVCPAQTSLTQCTTPQLQGSFFFFFLMYFRLSILKYRKAHILFLSKQELWHKWKQVHRNNEKKTQSRRRQYMWLTH